SVNYIDNSSFYNFTGNEENAMAEPTELLQVINIYYVNTLVLNGSSICGYAHLPLSYFGNAQPQETNRIVMKNSCANSATLAHEIGHYFSLRHTHDTSQGLELVNGSNCTTAGDGFCDTPADPNLSGNVNNACVYTGTETDTNGDSYSPLTNNIMSYSSNSCKNLFTNEQQSAIVNSLNNERNYLACNNNFAVTYTCNDFYEPSDLYYQATNYMGISNNIEENHCLSLNDIDWVAEFEVNNHNYYVKVEGVNNSIGTYGIKITTIGDIITIETEPFSMLNVDTLLHLYASDNTTILAQDDNSGIDNFSRIVYDSTLSIEKSWIEYINVFPNPVSNQINIQNMPSGNFNVKIHNVIGSLVWNKTYDFNNIQIPVSEFSKGIYIMRITTSKGMYSKKIIKQ
ncbi:MAG: zinc-dependent metalloprotease, partial [Flavobacteriaceae bacterium]